MSKPLLKTWMLLALLSVGRPVHAEPPSLDSLLQGPMPYLGVPRYESSADILLQMPARVDPRVPVPLGIRVFQDNVESITLLSDEVEPERLASFRLGAGVKPELSTRLRAWSGGLLVVVRSENRIFAARRVFTLSDGSVTASIDADETGNEAESPQWLDGRSVAGVAGAVASEDDTAIPAPAVEEHQGVASEDADETRDAIPNGDLNGVLDGMELRAWRGKDSGYVELRSHEPLSKRIEHIDTFTQSGVQVRRFELSLSGDTLISADIDNRLWFVPYFRFSFSGGEVGDHLVLTWWGSNGESGELTARIAAPD